MTDELDEILSDVMNYAVQLPRQYPSHNYEPTDGKVSGNIALFMYEYSRHAHQAIQALIADQVARARTTLLRDLNDCGEIHHSVYDYRIEELEQDK